MTVTCVSLAAEGGVVGRRVLMAKTDSLSNVDNNNGPATATAAATAAASVTGKASVLSVKRVLFGPPADRSETRAWLERQLHSSTAANSRSWNFDFVNERPMRDSPADRYAWERVCPPLLQTATTAATTTTTAAAAAGDDQQTNGGSCSRKRQSKVTDFMSKTKKRPLSAVGSSSNKLVDEEFTLSASSKRTRRTAI
ncbi:uncharacterized protein LOC126840667 [Adelges cooleyi]|uniref:uncharacterized protein LOC126840667 n=1 Tax=Adelges cooleyi TaxID=133065 RepID=UPI00217F28AB|nr:uncharacterized protein LOC126840667 [Adelges cooleyi]